MRGANSIPPLGIESMRDMTGRWVAAALRKVSGCSEKPSPSSGNWKSRQKLASLVGVTGKLVGQRFVFNINILRGMRGWRLVCVK